MIYTLTGKNIVEIEAEGYKVFNFIQKRGKLRLQQLVTDWIKDKNGHWYLLNVKSFRLTSQSHHTKSTKPTALEKE